jgi:uncharacterized protein YodC (DUF2158 family)
MENLQIGDLVVLTAGSMRMAVEGVEDGRVACVWCHEGRIGRDAFDARLLKKWEHREDDRPGRAESSAKPFRGERDGGRSFGAGREGGKPFTQRDDKPRGKPGWDGKPREKKYFRKEG